MTTFKAKNKKSKYKNTDSWLDAVYRNNKAVIDAELSGSRKSPKAVFKRAVYEYIEQGLSPTKAVKTLARSTKFTPKAERLQNNMWSGLTADRDAYQQFRELTKKKGRYTKFDRDKLVWDATDKVYIYDGSVIISYDNSPYGIKVSSI